MSAGRPAALLLALAAAAAPGAGLTPPERQLVDRMRGAGLERLERVELGGVAVRGVLRGSGGLTVLLFAGCGPGGEASRDAALLAAADLARTPRRHTLELLLCAAGGGGAEAAQRAAEGWLALHPAASRRDAVLAVLHLEVGDGVGGSPVGLVEAASGAAGRRLPPAWLAHAALRGAAGLAMGKPGWPLAGQLVGRHAPARRASGAAPFLALGMPALTFTGGGPEAPWPRIVAGVVRRLDLLAGRPRDDDVYLAVGGRVLARRDLYWIGLALWTALLVAGLPGAWRGTGSGQRRRRGRRYLPGFLFRMLFVVALLLAPASTLPLLAPAALVTLLPLRGPLAVAAGRALALAPVVLFLVCWAVALAQGRVAARPAQPVRLCLVAAGVGLAVALIGRPRRGGEAPGHLATRTARRAG